MRSASSMFSPEPTTRNTASELEHKSASSLNPAVIKFTDRLSSFSGTVRWTHGARLTNRHPAEGCLHFREINSAARWEDQSERIVCSYLEITKDSGSASGSA